MPKKVEILFSVNLEKFLILYFSFMIMFQSMDIIT